MHMRAHAPPDPSPQADGHAETAHRFDDAIVPQRVAEALMPGPFRVKGTSIVDAVGQHIAEASTVDVKGISEFKFAVAGRNAVRICEALNAEATRQYAAVIEAERGEQLPKVISSEHTHHCGVKGCDNFYKCHGARCAGNEWLCPACELDEKDVAMDAASQRSF
jgi:hypothetical protein